MMDLYRPQSLRWRENVGADRAEFTVSPPRLPAIPLLLFAAVWDTFIVGFVVGTHGAGLLFGALHIAAGVGITYAALLRLLVVSRITLSAEGFRLEHARIPARGARAAIFDVDGFDVAQVAVGWFSTARFGSNERTPWQLRLLRRDGVAERLALPIYDVEHLQYVAARLNATLAEMRKPIGYRDERMLPPAA